MSVETIIEMVVLVIHTYAKSEMVSYFKFHRSAHVCLVE